MIRKLIATVALATSLLAAPAAAKPVTDCPMRSAPFSVKSPLIDLMLSPAAMAVLDKHAPGRFNNLPPQFLGTKPPTFSAILSLSEGGRIIQMDDAMLARIDADLRRLPVTPADRVARCARYDNDRPTFTLTPGRPHLLMFEKINGFRDGPSVEAAHAAIVGLAQRNGWDIVTTEKGGAINPATLRQFDAIIWNNISGDVLTLSQRSALRRFVEGGGGFVAMHGSGGDPTYFWDWFVDKLIGARFIGHPTDPQFQDARITTEGRTNPIAQGLPAEWTMNDEWYSFRSSPRGTGANIILTIDEGTYKQVGWGGQNLTMGDHPMAWNKCVGRGRSFYSAIGHRPETYSQPQNLLLLENAIKWAAASRGACTTAGSR